MTNEMNDPEMSFRRGFQHGAQAVFETIEQFLPTRERATIHGWINDELIQWRLAAMQGKDGREAGKVTAACTPPVGRLRSLQKSN